MLAQHSSQTCATFLLIELKSDWVMIDTTSAMFYMKRRGSGILIPTVLGSSLSMNWGTSTRYLSLILRMLFQKVLRPQVDDQRFSYTSCFQGKGPVCDRQEQVSLLLFQWGFKSRILLDAFQILWSLELIYVYSLVPLIPMLFLGRVLPQYL